jgi:Uma2 family endonuclease
MVTTASLLTAEEYVALPDDGQPSELVRGNIFMMVPPAPRHGEICAQIVYLLRQHLDAHSSGRVLSNDSCVVTERNPDTVRGADVAFYSYQRVPRGPLPLGLLPIAPDLVFEVLSPTDRWSEVHVKVAEYLHAGVRAVCVLDDSARSIHVFYADRPSQVLAASEELTLPDVLGDFRTPVARFFE